MTPAELATDYVRVMTERDKYRAENIRLLAEVDRLTEEMQRQAKALYKAHNDRADIAAANAALGAALVDERARIRAAVEGLQGTQCDNEHCSHTLCGYVYRRAVLRVIDASGSAEPDDLGGEA